MTPNNIVEVNEITFESEVVNYSKNTPVVVDFWAEWCAPCKSLSATLEKILVESNGAFRLAKVNVDENPNLAILYGVRSLPTLKIFTNAQVIAEMVGNQQEVRLREFLAKITPPNPLILEMEKAQSQLYSKQWSIAEKSFRKILTTKPESPESLLGLAISLLARGESEESWVILKNFPASREFMRAQLLLPYAEALNSFQEEQKLEREDNEIALEHSLSLAKEGKFALALDGLLDLIRGNKKLRGGKAHKIILALLEILNPEDPITRQYRSELGSVLY